MKNEKKVYSLVTKEILEILIHLLDVALGMFHLLKPQTQIGKYIGVAILGVILVEVFIALVFRFLWKFDIVDEAAQEHYEKAKKKVFGFIWGFLCFASIVTLLIGVIIDVQLLAIDISFTINAWWLVILYGAMQIAISALFIYFEKREA